MSDSETAPRRAWLSSLRLTDFRNYVTLSLTLDERPVVLTGPNGAGKTNLLEAISFLSPGRGLRRAALADVARNGGPGTWAVAATVRTPSGANDIGTGIALGPEGPESQRQVRVNRAPAHGSDALLEYLRVVWLVPAMDGLFAGPASDRRRFLDRATLAIDRQHGRRVNAFERAMRGRNRLLAEGSDDARWFAAIEAEMAELAVAVAAARRECVSLLSREIAAAADATPTFPPAAIALAGTLEESLAAGSATAAEDEYRRALAESRRADRAAGRTLVGPHLTDLRVRHAPRNADAATCSTGEQKALLIGLVLAQARLAARLSGETPLVLLDEVAAHLDETRRDALFAALLAQNCQAFLTGTDAAIFAPFGNAAQRLAVSDGTVVRTA
jgi:DNA replication and repair protein RecF